MKCIIWICLMMLTCALVGCSGPKYSMIEKVKIPKEARVGVIQQSKCVKRCTDPAANPMEYSEAFRARLEEKLGKPVKLVPISIGDNFDYSPKSVADAGNKANVDFVVAGKLVIYDDPSALARTGAVLVTTITSILPIRINMRSGPMVGSDVEVLRVSDGKVIGTLSTVQTGSAFAGASGLTADIADIVLENQFANN